MIQSHASESYLSGLARVLFLGREPGLLAMLAAYLDVSGSVSDMTMKGRPVLAVGAVLAKCEQWERFRVDWNQILRQHGVTVAHHKDFAAEQGEYKVWPEAKRRRYIVQTTSTIRVRALKGYATTLFLRDYDRVARELEKDFSPLIYAAVWVMKYLDKWRQNFMPEEEIAYIFESGDEHDWEFKRIDEMLRASDKADHGMGGMRTLTLMDKRAPGAEPLQAADMLAWEAAKHLKEGPNRKIRVPLERLVRAERIFVAHAPEELIHTDLEGLP